MQGFLEFTEGISSPRIFRKWAAITTIGATLSRRVWTHTARGFTFPNMYVILVGRAGVGKSEAINNVKALAQATAVKGAYKPAVHLAPVDVTKGALLDYLAAPEIARSALNPAAVVMGRDEKAVYHGAFICISELGNLIREHDTILLSSLIDLYDGLPKIDERRRYLKNSPIDIPRPLISLLGGTTPQYLGRTFPPAGWDEGFMARVILIYNYEKIEPDLFGALEPDVDLAQALISDLRQIGNLEGQMTFTDAAKKAIIAWQKADQEPKPKHIRLEHYNTRRLRHALKLCTIAAIDKGNLLTIDVEDFQQALDWMIEAEQQMPQVFMELGGRADGQTMDELYSHVLGLWNSPLHGKHPVAKGLLVNFLRHRVVAWQIDKVIEASVEAELLIQCPVQGEIRYRPNLDAMMYKKRKVD